MSSVAERAREWGRGVRGRRGRQAGEWGGAGEWCVFFFKFCSYLLPSRSNASLSNALSVSCTRAHKQPPALRDNVAADLTPPPLPPPPPPPPPCQSVAGVESSQLY